MHPRGPSAPSPASGARRHALHVHRSADVWTWTCAVNIAGELRRALAVQPRVRLVCSAEPELAPIHRALAQAPLAWDRVDLAQADERWLLPDDPDSHAWRLRGQLLHHHAAHMRFEPITRSGRSLPEAVALANIHAKQPAAAALLGMGNDGHVASLFPRMAKLDRVLASREAYAAVDAEGCPSALGWPRRITLTPRGLAAAPRRLLALRGRPAREAFEYAMESGDMQSWPVLATLSGVEPLQVHWCA